MTHTTVLKKAMLFALVICMLTGLCGTLASADGTPTVEIGSVSASSGGAIQVPVKVSDVSNISVVQFAVSYDAEKLELISADMGSALPSDMAPTINTGIAGKVYFVWDTVGTALSGTGDILVMEFEVKGAATDEASIAFSETDEFFFAQLVNNNYVLEDMAVVPGTVTITDPQPEFYGRISGLGANLNDAMDLKVYVKDVSGEGTPRFRVTQPDRAGNPVLTQAASEADYALSNSAVYTVNWDEANSRWIIRIKVFPKFISSPFTVELLDENDEPLPLKGYLYQGVGSNAIANSHAYSFLDYVTIMKLYKPNDTRYTQLYDVMSAYGTLMKNW